MTSRFAALCVDCLDPEPLAHFWCGVLAWDVIDQDETGVSIGPADNDGPCIDFMRVPPQAEAAKNRLHIDLRADGCSTIEELDRLLALGARRVDVGQGQDVSWVVLADPEGNEFCLLSRTIQQLVAEGADALFPQPLSTDDGCRTIQTGDGSPPGIANVDTGRGPTLGGSRRGSQRQVFALHR